MVSHDNHWKTDQDNVIIRISIEMRIPDLGEDLVDPSTGEPAHKYKGYIDVEIVDMELKGDGPVLGYGITLKGGPPSDLEFSDQIVFYTLMLDENNDLEDNYPDYPFNDIDLMYTVIYSETYGWEFVREKYYVGVGWQIEDTGASYGLASSWPGGFSIDIWIPLEELPGLTEILPWKFNTETKTYPSASLPPIDDFVPDEGLAYLDMSEPTLPADVNGDRVVDIRDITIVALAFGTKPGDDNWNQIADLNDDEVVDIRDITIVALEFGKST